jgi:putative tryptophan/tyrosine transport system substrate-binding protein
MQNEQRKEMNRKVLIWLLTTALLSIVPSAQAQQPAKVPRIGFLGAASASALTRRLDAFRQGLREVGYFEGKNIAIEYRYADGKAERVPELAAELVALNPDVIVTYQTPSVLAVKKASATIPIVFTMLSFPVENGIVASFARPGGNATGLTVLSEELNGKRLELLKETVPKLIRIAVLSNPANPTQPLEWKEIQATAQGLGLKLQSVGVRNSKDFESAFEAALRERAQALLFLPEAVFSENVNRIVEFAAKNKLPSMYEGSTSVEAGGLMSYGPISTDSFRRAATYVDKILKGAKPADLPVERPAKFEFIINLKTAKQIGLTIPQTVLYRADKVIK